MATNSTQPLLKQRSQPSPDELHLHPLKKAGSCSFSLDFQQRI
jgi:hypothetical protein